MALPLPRPREIAKHFRDIADQYDLMENMETLTSAEVLNNILRTLERIETRVTAMDTRITAMDTRMDTRLTAMDTRMDTRMTAIEKGVAAMEVRRDKMEAKIDAVDYNSQARLNNMQITSLQGLIDPLRTSTNRIPYEFPEKVWQLSGRSDYEMDNLLDAYNLPLGESLEAKKRLFRDFIGLEKTRWLD